MVSLIGINIINGDKIINKGGVPIVLYAPNPEEAISDINDVSSKIGRQMRIFLINNIIRKTYNKQTEDLYIGAELQYVYYNHDTGQSKNGTLNIQDIAPLNIRTDDADIFYLSLYYIKNALINAISKMRMQQSMRSFDIASITDSNEILQFYNAVAQKHSADILSHLKRAVNEELYNIGLTEDNIKRLEIE